MNRPSARRGSTLARLRRVNRQRALWNALDAMSLTPSSLRPWVEVPLLDRESLEELQAELVAALGETSSQPCWTDQLQAYSEHPFGGTLHIETETASDPGSGSPPS